MLVRLILILSKRLSITPINFHTLAVASLLSLPAIMASEALVKKRLIDLIASSLPGTQMSIKSGSQSVSARHTVGIPNFFASLIAICSCFGRQQLKHLVKSPCYERLLDLKVSFSVLC